MLKAMYYYELPFARENINIVKKIMVLSSENGTILSGKTGTGSRNNKSVNGWFVGYVEKEDRV